MGVDAQKVASGVFSFDGIAFPTSGVEPDPLQPSTSWTDLGQDYESLHFMKHGDLCVVVGSVMLKAEALPALQSTGKWPPHIATVPQECWPRNGRLAFTVGSNSEPHRVEVYADGRLVWISGRINSSFISLSGISYPASQGAALTLSRGAQSFGFEFRPVQWSRSGEFCAVSGYIRISKLETALARLPVACRPNRRLSFHVNADTFSWRIDVSSRRTILDPFSIEYNCLVRRCCRMEPFASSKAWRLRVKYPLMASFLLYVL